MERENEGRDGKKRVRAAREREGERERERNLTHSAHRGTKTYLEVTAFPPPYAALGTTTTK